MPSSAPPGMRLSRLVIFPVVSSYEVRELPLTARRCTMDLVRFVQNMVTDSTLAALMQQDSASALSAHGTSLDDSAKEAILAMCRDDLSWQQLCNPALKLSLLAWAPT